MRQTTITCDRCKESWDKAKEAERQIWSVNLHKSCGGPSSFGDGMGVHAELCRPCMVLWGLLPSRPSDPPEPDPAPTALELIEQLAELLRAGEDLS